MATKRKFNIALDVDDRTTHMTEAALFCRSTGHLWQTRSASRAHTLSLLRQGLREFDRFCANGCGATWRQIWDLRARIIVENERRYPSGGDYLMPTGSGRLNRVDAIIAQTARQYADLVG